VTGITTDLREGFQNSTNEEDVGEGAGDIVRSAAADIFRPLPDLGFIVISNFMQAFRSKLILYHFQYGFVVVFGTHFWKNVLNCFKTAPLPDPFLHNFQYST